MPQIHMVVPHALGRDEALTRVRACVERLATEYARHISKAEQSWEGATGRFTLHIMGFPVSATATVGEADVHLDGSMPWAVALFRHRIEETIRRELGDVLR